MQTGSFPPGVPALKGEGGVGSIIQGRNQGMDFAGCLWSSYTLHRLLPGPFLPGQSRASRACGGFVTAGHRGAALGRARAEEWVMRPPSTQLPCASPASSFIAPSPGRPIGAVSLKWARITS
ncbi:hypothetical protein NN561_016472 [Cricetulus griseus]